jgi:hypothetical protein
LAAKTDLNNKYQNKEEYNDENEKKSFHSHRRSRERNQQKLWEELGRTRQEKKSRRDYNDIHVVYEFATYYPEHLLPDILSKRRIDRPIVFGFVDYHYAFLSSNKEKTGTRKAVRTEEMTQQEKEREERANKKVKQRNSNNATSVRKIKKVRNHLLVK